MWKTYCEYHNDTRMFTNSESLCQFNLVMHLQERLGSNHSYIRVGIVSARTVWQCAQ